MQINVTGHHVDITPSVNEKVNSLLSSIELRFSSLVSVNVILSKENRNHSVEFNSTYTGQSISVKASGENMFKVIRNSSVKFTKALDRRKGQIQAARKKSEEKETCLASELMQEMDIA